MEFLENHFLYLSLMIFSISFPLFRSFENKIKYYTKWKFILKSILFVFLFFIPWDVLFTYLGIWSFNDKYNLGFNLLNLPIEEWLFFIVVPYACLFIYEVLEFFFPINNQYNFPNYVCYLFCCVFLVLAILNYHKLYTLVCFILTSLTFLYLSRLKNLSFFRTYFVTLIPFILINGFLTGSFTSEAVVNYNPQHIIGFRFLNIPIEDFMYNFLLMFCSLFFYNHKIFKS